MPTSSSTSSNMPRSFICFQILDLLLNLSHCCGSNQDLAKLIIQTVDGAQVMRHASFAAKVIVPYSSKDNQTSSLMILCQQTGKPIQSKSPWLSSDNSLKLQRLLERLLQTSTPDQEVSERLQSKQGEISFYVRRTQLTTQELSNDLQNSLEVVSGGRRSDQTLNSIPWAELRRKIDR